MGQLALLVAGHLLAAGQLSQLELLITKHTGLGEYIWGSVLRHLLWYKQLIDGTLLVVVALEDVRRFVSHL